METGNNEHWDEEPTGEPEIIAKNATIGMNRDWYIVEGETTKPVYVSGFVDANGQPMSPGEVTKYRETRAGQKVTVKLTDPVVAAEPLPGRKAEIYTYTGQFIPESS